MQKLEKTISWQEFQERKNENRKEILEKAASRVEFGRPSHYNLDLDMLPIINTWDKLPFSFTIESCSGTPKEHDRDEYKHVNGLTENPNATLMAHSYIAHPLFNEFKDFLKDYLKDKADLRKSQVHGLEGYEGIYLHSIDIWVPKEVKESGDLEFLDRFWKDFNKELEECVHQLKYNERLWRWTGQ